MAGDAGFQKRPRVIYDKSMNDKLRFIMFCCDAERMPLPCP